MSQSVHVHQGKKYSKNNILLLLIPIFFFGLILATYLISKGISNNLGQISSISESNILGSGSELDK